MRAPSDTQAVANLVYSYAERLDSGDFEGLARLFERASFRASFAGRTEVHRGYDQVLSVFKRLVRTYEDGTPRTKHQVTNLVVEIDEAAGLARCRSYFCVLQQAPGLPLQPIIAGRYHDEFVKDQGTWRFADRLVLPELLGDQSRHLKADPLGRA
ncbi:MAG TPA: nuclear transport factor 2 family protein [Acidimicrobiales bacterium]|nr:nuclear transport factor 2 family protein [Acidimicrobiales bacterium]